MGILNGLYLVCIRPIEFWMDCLLEWGYALTHSWGLALLFLSCVVNTAILPIYNWAENGQEKERAMRRAMARSDGMIRRTFRGQKRFALLSTLRRQHGFTSLMSLRASVGLLLQIPFFFAAYHLLSRYEPLSGQAWGPFADLSAPDALLSLGGLEINVLPFVMTAVNLLSAFVYARTLTRRDKAQIYGMALLFLALLYTAPAALTLYWTLNNVYSFGKNVVEKGWMKSSCRRSARTPLKNWLLALAGLRSSRGLAQFAQTAGYSFVVGLVFWVVTCAGVTAIHSGAFERTISSALVHLSGQCLLTAVLASVVIFFYDISGLTWKVSRPRLFIFASVIVLFLFQLKFLAWGFRIVDGKLPYDMWNRTGAVTFFFWALGVFCVLKSVHLLSDANTQTYLSSAFFAGLTVLYISFNIFRSDVYRYQASVGYIAVSIFHNFLLLMSVLIAVYILAPKRAKAALAFLSTCFVFLSLLNYILFLPDFGILEGTEFHSATSLYEETNFFSDIFLQILLPLVLACLVFFAKSLRKIYSEVLVVLSIAVIILSFSKAVSCLKRNEDPFVPYVGRLHSYSKSAENVVILILDMFTGGHIERMIEDKWFVNFSEKMDGFIWYSDVISPGACTVLGLPAIYGGHGYVPEVINKERYNILDIINKSYAVMPRNFAKNGYDVVTANLSVEFKKELYDKYLGDSEKILTVAEFRDRNEKNNNVKSFFTLLSIFEMSPMILKRVIYDEGKWHGWLTKMINTSFDMYKEEHDFMSYVLENKEYTFTDSPTAKIIYTALSHVIWYYDADLKHGQVTFSLDPYPQTDDYQFINGIIPEHYFAERHLMRMIINFINNLKESGVYDNTRIILVSDHSQTDDQMIQRAYNSGQLIPDGTPLLRFQKTQYYTHSPDYTFEMQGYAPGRPHALLMVKEPYQRGPLRTSSFFMSTADVPALAMKSLKVCDECEQHDPEQLPVPRVLLHAVGPFSLEMHDKNRFKCKFFRFEGTVFDPTKVSEVQLE